MISERLQNHFRAATAYAVRTSWPETNLVHILLSIVEDRDFQNVLHACGVDYLEVRERAMAVLEESKPTSSKTDAGVSGLVIYVANLAHTKAKVVGRNRADLIDFVSAILEVHDNKTVDVHARSVLVAAGLSFSALMKVRQTLDGGELPELAARREDGTTQHAAADRPHPSPSRVPVKAGSAIHWDLTERARAGKVSRAYGREREIGELISILLRRRKANPLLVGEPGVGKTSLVDELACRIAEGTVPKALAALRIVVLDIAQMLAGTKYRGDLEERVKVFVEELKSDPDLVVFIDELHVLAHPGQSAAAMSDLLKPALSSGEVRCIGGTTFGEFKQYLERDGALSRRFRPVSVPEPDRDSAIDMVRRSLPDYSIHHRVAMDDELAELAVDHAIARIPERRLPDKALDLVDDLGSWAAMNGLATVTRRDFPAFVEQAAGRRANPSAMSVDVVARAVERSAGMASGSAEPFVRSVMRNALPGFGGTVVTLLGPKTARKLAAVETLASAMGRAFERLDLSRFREVSSIIGAPPGYVGHDKGGLLWDMAKRSPNAVVMLARAELAEPSVLAVIEEAARSGNIADETGKVTSCAGIQFIRCVDEESRRSIGFSGASSAADVAADVFRIPEPARRELPTLVRDWLDRLAAGASPLGVELVRDPSTADGIAEVLAGRDEDFETSFRTLVREPVLDYVVSARGRLRVGVTRGEIELTPE